MSDPIVIIGASLTGASAAAALRGQGYEGPVVLVGAESELPYERPPMSKEYLRGEAEFSKSLVKPEQFYAENSIELRLSATVTGIDTAGREVELADGSHIRAEKILIATGARNRKPPIPGLDKQGVHQLRTKAESDAIRAEAKPGSHAVVVGMGFIGAEVAAALRTAGVEVTAIDPFTVPLQRVFGETIGRALASLHSEKGVTLRLGGEPVTAFEGNGRVERVRLGNGDALECDFVVAGLGVEPVIDFLDGTDVAIDNGILVDEFCRTNVDGVYAAGDVANHTHPLFGRRMRVEHWQNAMRQGTAAAKSMIGHGEPYADLHWFWSDQYDENIQYAGHHTGWDDLVVRGSIDERKFVAFFISDGLIEAAAAMNNARDLRRSMKVISARKPVDPLMLADEDVDLRSLA